MPYNSGRSCRNSAHFWRAGRVLGPAADRGTRRKYGRHPGCALGPDYGQVGAEHVLIGDASTLRAEAQRACKSLPGRWMGGDRALLDRAAVGTGASQHKNTHRFAVEANQGKLRPTFHDRSARDHLKTTGETPSRD